MKIIHFVMLLSCACFNSRAKVNAEKHEYLTKMDQTCLKAENVFYLQINAKVKQFAKISSAHGRALDSVRVAVFNETNKNTRVFYSNEEGTVCIKLPLNQQYQMHFSRNGLVTKTILIDTRVSKQLTFYLYKFEVDMFEEIKEIDASILRNPIAEVKFNESHLCFDYTPRYTEEVNGNLKKEYVKHYRLHSQSKPMRNTEETDVMGDKVIHEKGEKIDTDTSTLIRGGTKNRSLGKVSGVTPSRNVIASFYQIQIMDNAVHLPSFAQSFAECGRVHEYIMNGKYIYTVGEYKTVEEAMQDLRRFRKRGFPNSFPVAVINGNVTKLTEDLTVNIK